MTDRTASYGKINVNLLNSGHSEYDPANDPYIICALFDQVRYGQSIGNLILESTRGTSGNFTSLSSGAPNTALSPTHDSSCVTNMTSSSGRLSYVSRAQFLNFTSGGGLQRAFGAMTSAQDTDAAQEEIIGKTINLLSAGTTSPAVVQVVVVAQSIRDMSGTQVKATSETNKSKFSNPNGTTVSDIEDGTVSLDCELGRFDMYAHDDDDNKNVYFDEITGEVKMLVTFDRDPLTGRLKLRQIDYL